jgi:hypothetical protein
MTQPEETEGMDITAHLQWVSAAMGSVPDYIIVNSEPFPDDLVTAYKQEGAVPLYLDRHQRKKINRMGCTILELPMIHVADEKLLRHNSYKLGEMLFRLSRDLEEGN